MDIQMIPGEICIWRIKGDHLPDSDALIARIAEKWCAARGHAPFRTEIVRPEFEKPRFIYAPDVHFSVSHSGRYWVCAMDDHPVGIDLQFRQKVNAASIARRHFHPLEGLWLEAHPDDFFKIWTAKEAYVKYTGRGIDNDFDAFSVVDVHGFRDEIEGAGLRFVPADRDYTMAIVGSFKAGKP